MSLELAITLLTGAFAWLIGKIYENAQRRRQRYAEIVGMLPSLTKNGSPEARQRLLNEVAKLWIDAPSVIVRAAEHFLDGVEAGSNDVEYRLTRLVITMRRENFLRLALQPDGGDRLEASEIKLRSANR